MDTLSGTYGSQGCASIRAAAPALPACDPEVMQTFKAKRVDEVNFAPDPRGEGRVNGLRAPGRIVMVVREGSVWVRLQDGTRENLTATSVVIWDRGDWVEYGSNTGEGCETKRYWAEDLSEEEGKAIFVEAFGPDAVADWHT